MSTLTVDLAPAAQDWIRRACLLDLYEINLQKEATVLEERTDASAERAIRDAVARVIALGELLDRLGYAPEPRPMTVSADAQLLSDLARSALEMLDDEIRGDIVEPRTPRTASQMQWFADCTAGLEPLLDGGRVLA